jgi:hypothetical protein
MKIEIGVNKWCTFGLHLTGRVVKMDFIVNNIVNVDTHPFEPFIKNDTKYLIVGTIPPHRFCINSLEDGDVK